MPYGILTVFNDEAFNIYVSALKDAGYFVKNVETGSQALQIARIEEPDLIIISKKLPDISGMNLLKLIKEDERLKGVPVLLFSFNRERPDNMVKTFDLGASDYLSGHIPPALLVARVKSWMRKIDHEVYGFDDGVLQRGIFKINTYQKTITVQDMMICFSPTEYKIFYLFARQTDGLLLQSSLIEYLYGCNDNSKIQALKMHIYRIRKKLNVVARNSIVTIRGMGYQLSNVDIN